MEFLYEEKRLMTQREIKALKRMCGTRGDTFTCELGIGPTQLYYVHGEWELNYPTHIKFLNVNDPIGSEDRNYLRYMYNEWLNSRG